MKTSLALCVSKVDLSALGGKEPPIQGSVSSEAVGGDPALRESWAEGRGQIVHDSANLVFRKVSGPPFSDLVLMGGCRIMI